MKSMNDYMMVAICGNKDDDGLIRFFGEKNEYMYHLECLQDYFYTFYPDLAYKVDADSMHTNEEIIMQLNNLDEIIYLHSPGYGLLFMPKEVSKKQTESLYHLFSSFEKTSIYIMYNLKKEDSKILSDEVMEIDDSLKNTDILDKFFDDKEMKKAKGR